MKHFLRNGLIALAAACLAVSGPARAATPQQVDAAVEKAKNYIYSQMKGNNWESVQAPVLKGPVATTQWHPNSRQWGGVSAIAVYGLLASGENPQSPKLRPAIDWLKRAPLQGHYAIGMRAQVWTFLEPKEAKLASRYDFNILSRALLKGDRKGLYSYYTDPLTGKPQDKWWDHSVSQIGVLGMWACEQAGQEVPLAYWKEVDERWKEDQQPDGGWFYKAEKGHDKVTGTMTAAGVATLFITQDFILQADESRWKTTNGGLRNESIDKGMAWMDKHVPGMLKSKDEKYFYYGLYGIERIGVASGRKYFGTVDWYGAGADELLKRQKPDGSWGNEVGNDYDIKRVPDTVFSILYLVRGRAPVVMNKLEYANQPDPKTPDAARQTDPWNERPRDVANFAHWSGKQTERFLNWQIVNLQVSPDDLHDAPILYVSGSEALNLSDIDLEKLRAFIEDGGLLLGNADGGSEAFAKSFVAIGKKLFPKYEFRDLPQNHTIYTDEQFKPTNWKGRPRLQGLSNGVRELMLLLPSDDPGKAFQLRAEASKEDLYQLMQDIFLYSISKSELRYRGQTYLIRLNDKIKAKDKVNLVRLQVGDNPDPEPGGWMRLASLLHNAHKLDVNITYDKLVPSALKDAKIAHLTGTTKFKLTPEQRAALKEWVANGGTLVVDAAGGSSEFATAAEQELAATFGGTATDLGNVLDSTHPVYQLPGAAIGKFGYRGFVKGRMSGRLNVPRVRGIEQNGRLAIFYSREDLSGGLVGEPIDGILGYDPATATAIMRNIVLYAARGSETPTAKAGAASAK